MFRNYAARDEDILFGPNDDVIGQCPCHHHVIDYLSLQCPQERFISCVINNNFINSIFSLIFVNILIFIIDIIMHSLSMMLM